MKRSEIINKIANDLNFFIQDEIKKQTLAEWILRTIENEGMEPPYSGYYDGNQWDEEVDFATDKNWRERYGKDDE